jgi:4-hydroxyphenylpyruvate dioxygenase-like putative hemolysin
MEDNFVYLDKAHIGVDNIDIIETTQYRSQLTKASTFYRFSLFGFDVLISYLNVLPSRQFKRPPLEFI